MCSNAWPGRFYHEQSQEAQDETDGGNTSNFCFPLQGYKGTPACFASSELLSKSEDVFIFLERG